MKGRFDGLLKVQHFVDEGDTRSHSIKHGVPAQIPAVMVRGYFLPYPLHTELSLFLFSTHSSSSIIRTSLTGSVPPGSGPLCLQCSSIL